ESRKATSKGDSDLERGAASRRRILESRVSLQQQTETPNNKGRSAAERSEASSYAPG
ncbi:MAG: hypothetical protein RLZZ34_1337, partial [Verrucomicrobiota bacterium]